ncbi:hypothetical protein CON64_05285 [Bacillus pseudomycoides]|nr:hypothetical protein CON64_05285 [Bacillus pseudomycoides]
MSLGKEIKKIYDAMFKICSETSHFISVVNDMFVSYGWKPVGDNAVMWDRSNHYAYPRFWLPYFQQRVFTTDQDFSKGVAINIIFDEAYDGITNTIPFVSCLYIEMQDNHTLGKCDEIYSAGWSESSQVVNLSYNNLYKTVHTNYISIVNYFLPLEVLADQEAVSKYVIKPLIQLHKGDIDKAYDCIKLVCLSREELSS